MKKALPLLLCFISVLLVFNSNAQQPPAPNTQNPNIKWFTDARFGMFIHWDMSSVAGTEISWSRKATKPLDIFHDPAGYVEDTVYDNLYKQFNPQKFDAKAWVALAKKAGMKYLVFTAKHHGGFCMWDTKYTDYSIMHTAFKRDVVKELADACHAEGLGFGIYYSPRDWHHPDYGIGDNQKYVDYMNGQLTELLTHYGKVDILWFDSYGFGKGINEAFWQIDKTYSLIKKLQPGILINNRLQVIGDENATYKGDWDTPEQQLGEFQNTRPWESCLTLVKTPDGGGWSYRKDGSLRSYRECINALLGCATGDGNLLLDAGPDATGVIPADQSARLIEMGTWLHKYGASIYGTRGGPFGNGQWGGATYKGNTVYLHITKFNGNTLTLPPLKSTIRSWVNLTNGNNKPEVTQTAQGITITLDASKQDAYDTIIALTLADSADKEDIPITVAK